VGRWRGAVARRAQDDSGAGHSAGASNCCAACAEFAWALFDVIARFHGEATARDRLIVLDDRLGR
jgi:hypothetical protein